MMMRSRRKNELGPLPFPAIFNFSTVSLTLSFISFPHTDLPNNEFHEILKVHLHVKNSMIKAYI